MWKSTEQVDEFNFKDIEAEMISEPKGQLESETDEKKFWTLLNSCSQTVG